MTNQLDLSVIIPALHEAPNLAILLPNLRDLLDDLQLEYEILIITRQADQETLEVAATNSAQVIEQQERGYGGALLAGFATGRGRYFLTMDADLSHQPTFIRQMWAQRHKAEVVIASRYVPGGSAEMPASRFVLSQILNTFFKRGLRLPSRDLSSGFRLYKAELVRDKPFTARDFDVLPEILVRLYTEGWRIQEVPFQYAPRQHGSSNARVFKFGLAYLRTFRSLWKVRNALTAADYEDWAYDSAIPLQRYWQRRRFRYVTELAAGQGPTLDAGCGSSRIITALPPGSVALDLAPAKLRLARKFGRPLVLGSALRLPFAQGVFSCVVCSHLIEHVPPDAPLLEELDRVLAPGGRLVLATLDYARWEWRLLKKLYDRFVPAAYADIHQARYTRAQLTAIFEKRGYRLEATRYILHGELIMAFRKGSEMVK